jgi:hypothetical protein
VTNWPAYDAALVLPGSIMVWFTEEAVAAWHAPATGVRGGQPTRLRSRVCIKQAEKARLMGFRFVDFR